MISHNIRTARHLVDRPFLSRLAAFENVVHDAECLVQFLGAWMDSCASLSDVEMRILVDDAYRHAVLGKTQRKNEAARSCACLKGGKYVCQRMEEDGG